MGFTQDSVVNRAFLSLHGGSLEITLTFPLSYRKLTLYGMTIFKIPPPSSFLESFNKLKVFLDFANRDWFLDLLKTQIINRPLNKKPRPKRQSFFAVEEKIVVAHGWRKKIMLKVEWKLKFCGSCSSSFPCSLKDTHFKF